MPSSAQELKKQLIISKLEEFEIVLENTDTIGSIWRGLFQNKKAWNGLFDFGIFPAIEELEECDPQTGENSWLNMVYYKDGLALFQKLLEIGKLPSADALSQPAKAGINEGINAWWCLFFDQECLKYLPTLLKNGVVPSADALSQPAEAGINKGINAWWLLFWYDIRLKYLPMLLDKGVVPSADALSQPAEAGKYEGINAWRCLFGHEKQLEYLPMLLEKGVVPTIDIIEEMLLKKDNKFSVEILCENLQYFIPSLRELYTEKHEKLLEILHTVGKQSFYDAIIKHTNNLENKEAKILWQEIANKDEDPRTFLSHIFWKPTGARPCAISRGYLEKLHKKLDSDVKVSKKSIFSPSGNSEPESAEFGNPSSISDYGL